VVAAAGAQIRHVGIFAVHAWLGRRISSSGRILSVYRVLKRWEF